MDIEQIATTYATAHQSSWEEYVEDVPGVTRYKLCDDFDELRNAVIHGYERATKEPPTLTWKEVKKLCDVFMNVGLRSDLPARSKELYEEVLRVYRNEL